jgi:hypothetical protein
LGSLNARHTELLDEITKVDGTFTRHNDDDLGSKPPTFPGTTPAVVLYFDRERHQGAPVQQGLSVHTQGALKAAQWLTAKDWTNFAELTGPIVDGEARINKQGEIVSRLQLLDHDSTQAKAILAASQDPTDIRQPIPEMSVANPLCGAPRIHDGLLKPGIDVG